MHGQTCMSVFVQKPAQSPVTGAHPSLTPHWLTHLGALGLFSVAVIDSSVIPLPLPAAPTCCCCGWWRIAAIHGCWPLCRCRQHPRRIHHLADWSQRRRSGAAPLRAGASSWTSRRVGRAPSNPGGLSTPLASSAIPLLPFALASGALGVTRRRFLVVFGAARSLRYSFVAWLGAAYGRRIVRLFSGTLQKWSTPLLCVFMSLLAAGICYGLWKIHGLRKIDAAGKIALHDEESRVG